MTPTATAVCIFDEATMSRGRYWHWFKTPWICWVLPAFGVIFISISIYSLIRNYNLVTTPLVLLVMGIYFVLRYWILGIRFRREIQKNPQYGKEFIWTFQEEGFTAHTAGSETKSDWTGFYQTYITPDGFLIYPQKGIFYWIPKSSFDSAESAAVVEDILMRKTHSNRIG